MGVLLGEWPERDPAVAVGDRHDAVHARRRRQRVLEQLRVVVGVRVDEPGRDDEAVGVDGLGGRLVDPAGLGDGDAPAVAHAHVRWAPGRATTVDQRAALDQVIEYWTPQPDWVKRVLFWAVGPAEAISTCPLDRSPFVLRRRPAREEASCATPC
jgi:hypothetical protein